MFLVTGFVLNLHRTARCKCRDIAHMRLRNVVSLGVAWVLSLATIDNYHR